MPTRSACSLIGLLALLLGADEQHAAAALGGLPEEGVGLVDEDGRLLQVDDVDAAALAEDELLHLGVPAAGLVAEVDAAGEQVLHADRVLRCRQDCLLLKRLLAARARRGAPAATPPPVPADGQWNRAGGRSKRLPPDTATDRGVRRVGVDITAENDIRRTARGARAGGRHCRRAAGAQRSRRQPIAAGSISSRSRPLSRRIALVCSCETRDSVTPSTSPISRSVRFS